MNLAQFRQQYPQYNDVPDVQLANAFHQKYYSDMPLNVFYQKIGLNASPGQSSGQSAPNPQAQTSGNQSLLGTVANSPGVNFALGAGDALRNTISSGLNLIPGVNISPVQSSSGTAYGAGNIAGNVAGFLGGGEALDAARAASEGIPMIGNLASALGGNGAWGVARRAIGNAAYGGLSTNTDRGVGAAEGAGLSTAADALPGIAKALAPAVNYFQPSKYAKQILNNLGGGQNLQDATQSVLQSIKSAYTANKETASDLYSPVLDSLSSSSIYNRITPPDPTIFGATTPSSARAINKTYYSAPQTKYDAYGFPQRTVPPGTPNPTKVVPTTIQKPSTQYDAYGVPIPNSEVYADSANATSSSPKSANVGSDWNESTYPGSSFSNTITAPIPKSQSGWDGNYPALVSSGGFAVPYPIQDLHNTFMQNPTLQNAHKLQSQLGTALGQLTNGITAPDQATWQTINSIGNARNALKSDINTFLNNSGEGIANQYQIASNYYRDNVAPYKNIPQIYSIAKGETTNLKPTALSNLFAAPNENLDQVLSDLPQDAINKILYTKLGQYQVGSPEFALQNKTMRLDQQGLGQFVSPELNAQLQSLQNRIHAKNAIQMAAGAALGASTGMPIGLEGAIPLGMLGAGVGKPLINYMNNRLPIQAVGNAIKKGVKTSYPYAKNVVLANLLNHSGGQQ